VFKLATFIYFIYLSQRLLFYIYCSVRTIAVVYSVGIGKDISWDEEMLAKFQTQQHGWDPTPTAIEFMKTKQHLTGFTYHEFGLGSEDGTVDVVLPNDNGATVSYRVTEQEQEGWSRISIPVLSLDSMMKMNGHEHLDILKFDIEGAEFDMIEKWAAMNYNLRADQVLIEFHERFFDNSEQLLARAHKNLKKLGFQLYHATSQEYVFIKGTLKHSVLF